MCCVDKSNKNGRVEGMASESGDVDVKIPVSPFNIIMWSTIPEHLK